MDEHLMPLDPSLAGDAELVARSREGDRIAFGVLYLRHHAAAWRVACTASGFSDDAEVAVIEGFCSVFSALPRNPGDGDDFRPYLLACVRQAALDRPDRRDRRHRRPLTPFPPPDPDELVLSELDHHLVQSALCRLPERWRTALWLTDVEAMTPAEVAAIVDLEPDAVPALAARAREEVREACRRAHQRDEVQAGCRFAVDHLAPYLDGELGQRERVLVETHVDRCVTCGMRCAELANVTDALLAAIPPPPLLGGECQRHWLVHHTAASASRGERRSLPPARAAARARTARGGRTQLSPSLALVAATLAIILGLPRLAPLAPSGPPETALVSPVVRAHLPESPAGARPATPADTPVIELVALPPAAEPPPPGEEQGGAEAAGPSAASAPSPPPAPPPVLVPGPAIEVPVPPLIPPLPLPAPAVPVVTDPSAGPEPPDRPGQGKGAGKGLDLMPPGVARA